MKKIKVIMSTDDNFVPVTAVSIISLLKYAAKDTFYDINIMSNISNENKIALQRLTKFNAQSSVNIIDICNNKNCIEIFNLAKESLKNSQISAMTFIRFFLPEIFTEDDKVLYIDVDTLVLKDLTDLYNVDVTDYYAAVVEDYIIKSACETNELVPEFNVSVNEYLQNCLHIQDGRYFNSGVMVINLKRMRAHNISEKLFSLFRSKKVQWHDQCILNTVLTGNVLFVEEKWNYFALLKKNRDASIVHFIGATKPWRLDSIYSPYSRYWWKLAKMSGFYKHIKQFNRPLKIFFAIYHKNEKMLSFSRINERQKYELKLFKLKCRFYLPEIFNKLLA